MPKRNLYEQVNHSGNVRIYTEPVSKFRAILLGNGSYLGNVTYSFGPFYTLLPRRWRTGKRHGSEEFLGHAVLISGVLESLVSLAILRSWYVTFFGMLSEKYTQYALTTHGVPTPWEEVTQAGFVTFITHPLTWVILFFGLEGIVRGVAGLVTGEVHGIFPLYMVALAFDATMKRRLRPDSALVRDEILPGDDKCDMRIACCRLRPAWKYPFTLRYGGTYFQVIAEKHTHVGTRPYVYSLRRLPLGEVARGLKNYDPDDVLFEPSRVPSLG
jgi:hypothetical protein